VPEIQKADPRARRLAVWIVAGGGVVGFLLLLAGGGLRPVLEHWIGENPAPRLRVVLTGMILLTVGPVLGMAAYLWRLGARTIRERRFPAPGLRVTRDTLVLVGQVAARRGRVLQRLAMLLAASGIGLGVMLWRLFALFARGVAAE
jgi:hypothetical protein